MLGFGYEVRLNCMSNENLCFDVTQLGFNRIQNSFES